MIRPILTLNHGRKEPNMSDEREKPVKPEPPRKPDDDGAEAFSGGTTPPPSPPPKKD